MTEAELSEDADARLADALERVAHGAVVSVPSLLAERLLVVAFTALLTTSRLPNVATRFRSASSAALGR